MPSPRLGILKVVQTGCSSHCVPKVYLQVSWRLGLQMCPTMSKGNLIGLWQALITHDSRGPKQEHVRLISQGCCRYLMHTITFMASSGSMMWCHTGEGKGCCVTHLSLHLKGEDIKAHRGAYPIAATDAGICRMYSFIPSDSSSHPESTVILSQICRCTGWR